MLIEKLDAKYVHMKNAQISVGKYSDGTLALVGQDTDAEGFPNTETFSVNLGYYGLEPPEGHVYIKTWSEGEGVAEALAEHGVVTLIEEVKTGPFQSLAWLAKVNDSILSEVES